MYLPIQLAGLSSRDLASCCGSRVSRIAWPAAQSSDCTWHLELIWLDGAVWTVRGVPTMTESGHEVGSLRVERTLAQSLPEEFARQNVIPSDLEVASISIGTASEAGVKSDCGISFSDRAGNEWAVVTAPATGAVAVIWPGEAPPATEFLLSVLCGGHSNDHRLLASRGGGLTMRSSRSRFVTQSTWHIQLAMCFAPLRVSA